MKITKYDRAKEEGSGSRVISSGTLISSPSSATAALCDEAKRLKETHLIFGQPFNGSQDVSGDITNAQNITAVGGDLVVKSDYDEEGINGGNIFADVDIEAGNNVIGKKFIGDVEAQNVTTVNLEAENGNITQLRGENLGYDYAEIRQAIINDLTSVDIVTENLTVTKLAHFFELVIDKIKAAGGAVLLTPADGFKVEIVEELVEAGISHFRLFFKANDGEKAISNMWQEYDQAICQTFNAAEGTSYNVSNKYYWALVEQVGTEKKNGIDYHYIQVSTADYDGALNPEVGDEIAMLGSRSDDVVRQSAIYLAAYSSIDPTLKAPLICQYRGINDYDLKSHKYTYFAANGSEVRGNFKMESGQSLEDYVDYKAITIVAQSVQYTEDTQGVNVPPSGWSDTIPYVPPSHYLWTRNVVVYSDGTDSVSYSVARFGANGQKGDKGDDGADGSSYTANLLNNTQNFDGDGWVNKNYWIETGETYLGCKVYSRASNSYGMYQDFDGVEGETYTFSAYIKSDGGDIRYYFNVSGGATVTPQNKDIPESNEWTRVGVTIKCTKSGAIRCRVQKATGTGTVYVAGYKLEKGENPNTVWTPSATDMVPEDSVRYFLMADSNTFQIDQNGNITPEQITVRAYKQIGNKNVEEVSEAAIKVWITDYNGTKTLLDEDNESYTIATDDIQRHQPSQFTFELQMNNVICDSLTIPIINDGLDADYYKLEPVKEWAEVDRQRNLNVDLKYNIIHIVGKSKTTIAATSGGYYVRIRDNSQSTYINLSYGSLPTYTKEKYLEQYENNQADTTQYFEVFLMKGSEIVDRRIVPVKMEAVAVLEIADEISSRVIHTNSRLDEVENNVSTLTQTAESIKSTVSQHTTQISGLDGTVSGHTSKIAQLEQTANGLKSTVESHTTDINGNKDSISQLQQTAEQIQLQVNNVSLQVNSKKIVLDGETEVNGTVNVNKDGTGFRLNGSNGESFTIGSNDIGTYQNFENKTVQTWWHNFNNTTINFSGRSRDFSINSLCTTLKVGQRLRITNLIASKTDYSFANSGLNSLSISIFYKDPSSGNLVAGSTITTSFSNGQFTYQGNSGFSGSKAAIIDYTATRQGEYYIRVNGTMTGTAGGYTILNLMLRVEVSLSAFGNLTYNGFGFNFGGGKVAFIGNDSMVFKLGSNAALKLTEADGLQRLVPDSYRYSGAMINHYYTNSAKWIGVNDYVVRIVSDLSTSTSKGSIDFVSPRDEMLVVKSISQSIILVLPAPSTCPGKSYIIKNRSTSDNLYISGHTLQTNSSGTGYIVKFDGNGTCNDWCKVTTSSGESIYWQLLKCYKHSHKLVSDGEKWIDCLLSN